FPTCWVFYWQTTAYLSSRDIRDMWIGHGPVLIDKDTGETVARGSAYSVEGIVAEHQARQQAAAREKREQGQIDDLLLAGRRIQAIHLIRSLRGFHLREAIDALDARHRQLRAG